MAKADAHRAGFRGTKPWEDMISGYLATQTKVTIGQVAQFALFFDKSKIGTARIIAELEAERRLRAVGLGTPISLIMRPGALCPRM